MKKNDKKIEMDNKDMISEIVKLFKKYTNILVGQMRLEFKIITKSMKQ